MSPIQVILVHLDGTQRAASRLRVARDLAALHRASVSAVYAVSPRFVAVPADAGAPGLPLVDEFDQRHRDSAKALFEQALGQGSVASTWHEVSDGWPIPGFVERAFLADLLVLGQRDATDASGFDVPADFVEAVIVDSGKPAFVVPYTGEAVAAPRTVLVAWKPTREAAHAVTAALPFLRSATSVHVACAQDNIVDTHRATKDLLHYLGQHGIAPSGDRHTLAGRDVGEELLSLAANVGADLLVMGCYGHGRARELVLGGASRTVLRSMTLPVLMAH